MLKNLAEVQSFMEQEWLASFVTVDSKSKPHVVPVWFTYDNGKVHVQSDRKSVKIQNIKRNGNVAVAVYCGEEAVIIRGRGRVIDDEKKFARLTQRHIEKYNIKLDEHGRDSMGIPLFDSKVRCITEVTPDKVLFW